MGTELERPDEQLAEEEAISKKESEVPIRKNFEDIINQIEKHKDEKNIIIEYRTIYNHGVMSGDNTMIDSININKAKDKKSMTGQKNLLDNEKEFNTWLISNYETYAMALLIAGAVFEGLPTMWVTKAANTLFLTFGTEQEESKYGMMSVLEQFGAKICQGEMNTYTGKVKVEIISFAKRSYSENIIKQIWRECPQLRDILVRWLKIYYLQKPLSMSRRASEMIGQLASWDYYYFQNNLIAMISADRKSSTNMLIAQILISLSRHKEYKRNVHSLMSQWNKEYGIHHLLINLYVCAEDKDKRDILENAIHRYVQEVMKSIQKYREDEWLDYIYNFFAAGMRMYTFYKVLVEDIYERAFEAKSSKEKKDICNLFLRLFSVDVDLVRYEEGEEAILVKLCTTVNEVDAKLCYLWQMVWQCRFYRQAFYRLMVKYEANVTRLGNKSYLCAFINKALGSVCTEEIQRDICNKVRRRVENE